MTTPYFIFKTGDTIPIAVVLKWSDGTVEQSLSTATSITFAMRAADVNYLPAGGPVVASGACSIVDEANGIVSYGWGAGETDVAGQYVAEIEVVDSAGVRKSFPATGYLPILITVGID